MNMIALVSGLLMGLGLLLSGMTNPDLVLAFLDISGDWKINLAFVMAGGLLIGIPVFSWIERRGQRVLCGPLSLPKTRAIDVRLVLGAALFGAGWGLVGLCPGPALVAMSMGYPEAWIFGGSMLAGMVVYRQLSKKLA